MPRESGRHRTRERIAHIAARLMAEDGIEDHALAKRKAARQMGVADARQMPGNDEIDEALRTYRAIYRPENESELRALRQAALAMMRELAPFNPHLVGSVLNGSAGKYAAIQLQLFTDSTKSVEHYLLGQGIQFRGGEARLFAGDLPISAPVLSFDRDGDEFQLTVLTPRDLRLPLRMSAGGKPIDRAKPAVVEALLAQNPD